MIEWLQMQERFLSREFLHQLLDYEVLTHGINFVDMLLSMILATIIGLITGWTYRKVQFGVNYSKNFEVTIVMIAIVVTMIMAVVGSNIARAFSLVGALSIVRFRTAVRSGLDITFIFFSVGIGLCLGSRFFVTAIFCCLWFNMLALVLKAFMTKGSEKNQCIVLKTQISEDLPDVDEF